MIHQKMIEEKVIEQKKTNAHPESTRAPHVWPPLRDVGIAPPTPAYPAPSTFTRLGRFNIVGGIGIVVQFAALFLLKSVMHFHYLLATAIAVEAAVVHNFVWHEQFTWVDRVRFDRVSPNQIPPRWRRSLPRLLRFNLANGGVSILGNLALMKVLVGAGHLNYLLANAIAITLCSLANFLVSDAWVFAERPTE